jgi:hypothetical protein
MPRRPGQSIPSYRQHNPTGKAVVTIAGRDCHLGSYGSAASKSEYDRLITEWLAAGRPTHLAPVHDLTIAELCLQFWQYAKQHYRKRDHGTSEIDNVRYAIRPLRRRAIRAQPHPADLSRGSRL